MDRSPGENLPDLLPDLRRLVARYASAGEVDDLTQECCVRIVEKEGLWDRSRGPFGAWARQVARGVTFNALGRRRPAQSLTAEPPSPESGPTGDQVGWVLEQLARLPEAQREALMLRYYEGLSVAAVGESLGISQPAASKRLTRALDTLRRRARQQGFFSSILPAGWAAALAGSTKVKTIFSASALALALGAAASGFYLPDPDTPLVAETSELERTIFADSLAAPLDPSLNTIWCASLPLAWGELRTLLGGEVLLEGSPAAAARLNASPVGREDVPPGSLVAAAGRISDGIVERIQSELEDVFGEGRDPVLDRHAEAENLSLLAYAFLYRSLHYAVPFEDLEEEPLAFRFADGERERTTRVDAFGIAELIEPASMVHHRELVKQVRVHDYRGDDDCIVRLVAEGSSDWVLLVQTRGAQTLGELWRDVRERVRSSPGEKLRPGDSLRVPELDLHLTHHFEELVGRHLLHADLEDQYLSDCVQDLRLKFDERGVEVKSRTVIPVGALSAHRPKQLVFDQPFLLLLAREGARQPYLALWVAHPEILLPIEAEPR